MVAIQLILVDSSIWIPFLRSKNFPERKTLDQFLSVGQVATCSPIRAEILSGMSTQHNLQRLRKLFEALIILEPPENIWTKIEEVRFALARRGIQTSMIDLWIALTAQHHQAILWTTDEDFRHISNIIPLNLYQ